MATYAVMNGDIVENIIVADTQEIAELVSNASCVEYTDEDPLVIGDVVSATRIKQNNAIRAKKKADAEKAAAKAEADRIAAIEAENERLRKAEADRLAAEEASKPKPVTGIFVKVSEN